MPNDFAGIEEKLKRSNENIRNLETEIARFFQEGKYPIIPEHDRKLLLEAIEYHKNRPMPLRFSVLAGEIVHHLRSCLDHVAWQFSSPEYRRDFPRRIEFSIEFRIFDKEPLDEDSIARYERKIKGITNSGARLLIESLQPQDVDSSLLIIHNMDVFDKHRELILFVPTGAREFKVPIARGVVEAYKSAHPESTPADIAKNLQAYGKLAPQVAFRNFGRREIQPVAPGLMELHNYIVKVVELFDHLSSSHESV